MNGRRIVFTSGKGGVGKSTVVANVGMELAVRGERVVLVDADIGLNNLDVALGLEKKIKYDLMEVALGKVRMKDALVRDDYIDNLYLLPSPKGVGLDKLSSSKFVEIVSELGDIFDYVLIDCPAGIDGGFHRAVSGAKEAIVITTPHISAVRDADKVCALLSTYSMKKVELVINRVRPDLIKRGDVLSPESIARLMRVELIGVVPEDDSITLFTLADTSRKNTARRAYKSLVDNVMGRTKEVYDFTKKRRWL